MLTIKRDEPHVEKLELVVEPSHDEILAALEEIIHQVEREREECEEQTPAAQTFSLDATHTNEGSSYATSTNYFTTAESTTNPYYESLKEKDDETYQTGKSTNSGVQMQEITKEVETKIINAQFGVYQESGKLVCEEKKRSDPTYIANFTLNMLMYNWMQHVI